MANRVRELEVEVERLRAVAADAERQRHEFAGRASHDLKAPLRGIRSLTSFIREDTADALGTHGEDLLGRLDGRVKRMERLVDALAAYGRSHDGTAAPTSIRLKDLLADLIAEVGVPAHFTVDVDDDAANDASDDTVFVVHSAIEQTLTYLIENAWEHHQGAASNGPGHLRISTKVEADLITFTLTDDGPGIDPELTTHVFDPFRTGLPVDASAAPHSGMGLAIAAAICAAHQATITVQSTGPEGTALQLQWPCGTRPEATPDGSDASFDGSALPFASTTPKLTTTTSPEMGQK